MASLYSQTRNMYGQPKLVECVSLEQLNTFRINLIKEYQEDKKEAVMILLNTQYSVKDKIYQDLLGFIAKATESTMKNHKYFARRGVEIDDVQEVLLKVLTALKSMQLDTIKNEAAIGSYLITTIRFSINKYLRDLLRMENRGLPSAEWTSLMDVEMLAENDEIITEYIPSTPDEVYDIENEEIYAVQLINKLGSKRQKEAMLLATKGKTYKEIAEIMNIDEGTVKVNISMLKAKLAAYHARD